MLKRLLLPSLAAVCCLPPASALAAKDDALRLARTVGGQIEDVVTADPYAYIATGRTVTTWTYADPQAPSQVSVVEQPASGRLTGLTKYGDYLYASWQTGFGTSGVAVYSLADPARPKLLNDLEVLSSGFNQILAIAAANGHLFLFDLETGISVASLRNPRRPAFRKTGVGLGVQYQHAFSDGNWIHAFGKNFLGDAVLTSFDVSNPRAPLEAPSFQRNGVEFFNMRYDSPLAVFFGLKLSILDLTDPLQPVLRSSVDGPSALTGILNGEYAYGIGFEGLDVWKIGDAQNPVPVAHLNIDTLAADATATLQDGALMITRTDRFVYLDTSDPASPKERSSALLSGSIDAYDAARVGDTVLLMQQNYGLAVTDPDTLNVVGRYEFDLPPALQARAFNDMHVTDEVAYLAAWGYGLLIADVSNPRAPTELARSEFFGAHTVSVSDGLAYLGKNTNGTELAIMDVSDPKQPTFLLSYGLPYTPAQVEARDKHVYIASSSGLRILEASNPYWVVEVAHYDQDCDQAFGITFEDDIPLAYVACSNGLHILDVSRPDTPIRSSFLRLAEAYDVRINLDVQGNRAWYGSGSGIYEIDVTNPKMPQVVGYTDVGGFGPVNIRALSQDRVLALTGIAGIHVLERAAQ